MTIQKKAEAKLPTHWGDFSVIAFEDENDRKKTNRVLYGFR